MDVYCKTTYGNWKFNTYRLEIKHFQIIHASSNMIFNVERQRKEERNFIAQTENQSYSY